MNKIGTVIWVFVAVGMVVAAAKDEPNGGKGDHPPVTKGEIRSAVEKGLPLWDRNKDGRLGEEEVNALIENPNVRDLDAAMIVWIKRKYFKGVKNKEGRPDRVELLAELEKAGHVDTIRGNCHKIRSFSRDLFLPGEPDLKGFHQGNLGDCYLMAGIASVVYNNPAAIKNMFQTLPNGLIAVRWPSGLTHTMIPVTDAELLLGARVGGNNGIWLNNMQKAYSLVREQKIQEQILKGKRKGKLTDADDRTSIDIIGHGGTSRPITFLMTGHNPDEIHFKGMRDSPAAKEKFHQFLAVITAQNRMITLGSGPLDIPGIPHSHRHALLEYNPATRMVLVFNPWGDRFKPKGPPGLEHGYERVNGFFTMPLDDLVRAFAGILYSAPKEVKLPMGNNKGKEKNKGKS